MTKIKEDPIAIKYEPVLTLKEGDKFFLKLEGGVELLVVTEVLVPTPQDNERYVVPVSVPLLKTRRV
tara:strand:+ start:491 stop:691 length:201 start_codon:yes stop_codon:yes gene_type:complete